MAVKRSAKDLVTVVFTWRGKDYQIIFDSQKRPSYIFLPDEAIPFRYLWIWRWGKSKRPGRDPLPRVMVSLGKKLRGPRVARATLVSN